MKSKALRSQDSTDWGTPDDVLDAVRAALGGSIDLDPCCSEPFRRGHAKRYYAAAGLELAWDAKTVFCNPPGNAAVWFRYMCSEYLARQFERGVFLAYSASQLSQIVAYASMMQSHIVIGTKRWEYLCTVADRCGALGQRIMEATEQVEHAKTEETRKKAKRKLDVAYTELANIADLHPQSLVVGDAPTHPSALVTIGPVDIAPLSRFGPVWSAVATTEKEEGRT